MAKAIDNLSRLDRVAVLILKDTAREDEADAWVELLLADGLDNVADLEIQSFFRVWHHFIINDWRSSVLGED